MRKVIILMMGRSGSGKSYLERNLKKAHPDDFYKVISTTTRPPRDGEVNGVDYYFVDDEIFEESDLVQTTLFHGNKYGSDISQYNTKHTYVTLVVAPESAASFKKVLEKRKPEAIIVCVYFNITAKKLKENMENRGDTFDAISDRIRNDKLDEQFAQSGLVADYTITDDMLNDTLPEIFYKWLEENTTKKYIHAVDILNKRICVGDIITYPVRISSSMWMSMAVVYDITYYPTRRDNVYKAEIHVQVPGYSWRKQGPIMTKTRVYCWERVVILPVAEIHDYSHNEDLSRLMDLRHRILHHEDEKNS